MTSAVAKVTAASAPGKVLLTGGYLILEREHTGLVFALDARIHVQVKERLTETAANEPTITVRSPQFSEASWEYKYDCLIDDRGAKITQLDTFSSSTIQKNDFVETTLVYVLTYILKVTNQPVHPVSITVLADNDYYTKPTFAISKNRFIRYGVTLAKANKTGLGSSAALVTALTAALLAHYLPRHDELSSPDTLSRIHNLAQAAHCAAQGKIGSGFDVASAVYGSCIYRRFSLMILIALGEDGSPNFATRLKEIVHDSSLSQKWDMSIDKPAARLPTGLRLVMCDVKCGSQTPGMVKRVLVWKKENPKLSKEIWTKLQAENDNFASELLRLSNTNDKKFKRLGNIILNIRSLVKELSQLTNVPIEPSQQTQLIDACTALTGVVGGMVPGAGGYDAIVLLVEDKNSVIDDLDELFSKKNRCVEDQTSLEIGNVTRLGVREDAKGLGRDDINIFNIFLSNYIADAAPMVW